MSILAEAICYREMYFKQGGQILSSPKGEISLCEIGFSFGKQGGLQ